MTSSSDGRRVLLVAIAIFALTAIFPAQAACPRGVTPECEPWGKERDSGYCIIQRQECAGQNKQSQTYGAIAYSEENRSGAAWDRQTQADADSGAIRFCIQDGGTGCKVVKQFWGKFCGAVANASNGTWGSGSGYTNNEAGVDAVSTCRNFGGTDCKVKQVGCNSR